MAKVMVKMTFVYLTTISVTLDVFIYVYAQQIALVYTEDEEIVAPLAACIQSLAFFIAMLGFTYALQGTLKAL